MSKDQQKERSGEGDYPKLRLTMLPLEGPQVFEVIWGGYFFLCNSVYEAIAPQLSATALAQFRRAPFMAYCFGLLAKRIWQILRERSTSGVSHSNEPAVPITVIPRPIYIYLASLGDFSEAELGVRFELDVKSSTILDIVATAQHISDGGDDFANLTWSVVGNDNIGVSRYFQQIFERIGQDYPEERFSTEQERLRVLAEFFGLNEELTVFLYRLVVGWYANPIYFQRGVQDIAGFNQINGELHGPLRTIVAALQTISPIGFAYPRHCNQVAALVLPQQFLSVLQAQVPKRYRCATSLPSTFSGVRSQLCYAAPGPGGLKTIAVSPFPLAPTYIGVAIACGFRRQKYELVSSGGFTTIPYHETIKQIRDGWAISNVLGH